MSCGKISSKILFVISVPKTVIIVSKVSISSHELQRSIFWIATFYVNEIEQLLREFITILSLFSNVFLGWRSLSTEIMPCNWCRCKISAILTNRTPNMCFGGGETWEVSNLRKLLTKSTAPDLLWRTIILWFQSYQDSDHSQKEGFMKRWQWAEKSKSRSKRCSKTTWEARCKTLKTWWDLLYNCWEFLRKKLKLLFQRMQIRQRLSETENENPVSLAQLFEGKQEWNMDFLQSNIICQQCSFSLQGSVSEQNCRIWGSQRPKKVWITAEPTLMIWCASSKTWGTRPFPNYGVATGKGSKNGTLHFFQILPIRLWHGFSTEWGFSTVNALCQTVYWLQASKHRDDQRWTGYLAYTVFWPDWYDLILWGYLRNQVLGVLPQNIPDPMTKHLSK